MLAKLTGLHKTYVRLSDGGVRIYAYAFKGGPLITKAAGRTREQAKRNLAEALGRVDVLNAYIDATQQPAAVESNAYVRWLVTAYLGSPEFAKLKATTQREYRRYLDAFRSEFGDWKVKLFERHEVKADLLDWRDSYADRPRAADYAMTTVGRLFSWARSRGLTSARPTDDVSRLHEADRNDLIWTDDNIDRFCAHASLPLQRVVRLAAATGLRQGDLISLSWNAIRDDAIVMTTSKRRKQVVVPLTAEAQAIIAQCPKVAVTVLTNTLGRSWTSEGLKTVFGKAKTAAGIERLRFHDLRGTAATKFRIAGLDDRDIALVMGWSESAVTALMRKYVSSSEVALDLLERMKQKPLATKQSQNP